jgi:hypothetical protein
MRIFMTMTFLLGDLRRLNRRSGADLAHVVAEPIFDISWLVEAALHPCLDPVLGGWVRGRDLGVGRQAGSVGEALRVSDRLLVE